MKVNEVLTGTMTVDQALKIFSQYGEDVTNANSAQVKTAYKRLMRQYHPDVNPTADKSSIGLINAARDVLAKFGTNPRGPASTPSGGRGYSGYRGGGVPPQNDEERYPVWAQAGHSGGMPENGRIYRQDYTDMNFIKKRMWELSGHSKIQFSLDGFDGHYFRAGLTVFGSPTIFDEMAKAIIEWQTKGGNPYECRAVFVSKRGTKQLYLIYADGVFYGKNPIAAPEHNSFNANASNDQQWLRVLPEWLDQIREQSKGPVGDPNRIGGRLNTTA